MEDSTEKSRNPNSHLSDALIDVSILRQGADFARGQLEHSTLAGFCSHLCLHYADLLLRKCRLLLDFLQKLNAREATSGWASGGNRFHCSPSAVPLVGSTCCSWGCAVAVMCVFIFDKHEGRLKARKRHARGFTRSLLSAGAAKNDDGCFGIDTRRASSPDKLPANKPLANFLPILYIYNSGSCLNFSRLAIRTRYHERAKQTVNFFNIDPCLSVLRFYTSGYPFHALSSCIRTCTSNLLHKSVQRPCRLGSCPYRIRPPRTGTGLR